MRYTSKALLPTSIRLRPKIQQSNNYHFAIPIQKTYHRRRQPISTTTTTTTPMAATSSPHSLPQPNFSAGSDTAHARAALAQLLQPKGQWHLTPAGNGVERALKFKGFKKTWDFMNAIAAQSKARNHHPEWSNVYSAVFVRWTTHTPSGLSLADLDMARFCDDQALVFGEILSASPAIGEGEDAVVAAATTNPGLDVGRELADRVALEGGQCCVPKPKAQP